MDKYFFIYRNSTGHWNSATNPKFIAEHTCCRAISKKEVLDQFDSLEELLFDLNGWALSEKAEHFVLSTDLSEIF